MDLNEYDVKAIENVCAAAVMVAVLVFVYFMNRDDR